LTKIFLYYRKVLGRLKDAEISFQTALS